MTFWSRRSSSAMGVAPWARRSRTPARARAGSRGPLERKAKTDVETGAAAVIREQIVFVSARRPGRSALAQMQPAADLLESWRARQSRHSRLLLAGVGVAVVVIAVGAAAVGQRTRATHDNPYRWGDAIGGARLRGPHANRSPRTPCKPCSRRLCCRPGRRSPPPRRCRS